MKVVNVVFSIKYGGVGSVVREILRYQNRHGYESFVISFDSVEIANEIKETYGLSYHFLPIESRIRCKFPTVFGICSKAKANRLLGKNDDVIFHYHNPISAGLFGYFPCGAVCTIHGRMNSANPISKFLFKQTLKRVVRKKGKLVGCSNDTTAYYQKMLHLDEVYSVPNGISIPTICENAYGIKKQKFTFLFAARLDELKGWNLVLNGFLSLHKQDKDRAELVFCGVADEIIKNEILNLQKEGENIRYLGVIDDVPSALMPYCDAVVMASRTEGLPMVFLEAISLEKPIITTPVGGIPELVSDGYNGLFCERSPESIQKCMSQIMNDSERYRMMCRNSKEKYIKDYTSEIMGRRYADLYRS